MIIYTSTDANEIKAQLELQLKPSGDSSYAYFFPGRDDLSFGIQELDVRNGKVIQDSKRLTFNPYSVIDCSDERTAGKIISKLMSARHFVATLDGAVSKMYSLSGRLVSSELEAVA